MRHQRLTRHLPERLNGSVLVVSGYQNERIQAWKEGVVTVAVGGEAGGKALCRMASETKSACAWVVWGRWGVGGRCRRARDSVAGQRGRGWVDTGRMGGCNTDSWRWITPY